MLTAGLVLAAVASVGMWGASLRMSPGARLESTIAALKNWKTRSREDLVIVLPLLAGFILMTVAAGQAGLSEQSLTGAGTVADWALWVCFEVIGAGIILAGAVPLILVSRTNKTKPGVSRQILILGAFVLALPAMLAILVWGIPGFAMVMVPYWLVAKTRQFVAEAVRWWGIEPGPASVWAAIGVAAAVLVLLDHLVATT